jgi:hypothetical protein
MEVTVLRIFVNEVLTGEDDPMTKQLTKCPLCKRSCDGMEVAYDTDEIWCSRCGNFVINRPLRMTLEMEREESVLQLALSLAVYIRQANERGELVTLDPNNWTGFAEAYKQTLFSRKSTKLLELIAARSSTPGSPVELNPHVDPASSRCCIIIRAWRLA